MDLVLTDFSKLSLLGMIFMLLARFWEIFMTELGWLKSWLVEFLKLLLAIEVLLMYIELSGSY